MSTAQLRSTGIEADAAFGGQGDQVLPWTRDPEESRRVLTGVSPEYWCIGSPVLKQGAAAGCFVEEEEKGLSTDNNNGGNNSIGCVVEDPALAKDARDMDIFDCHVGDNVEGPQYCDAHISAGGGLWPSGAPLHGLVVPHNSHLREDTKQSHYNTLERFVQEKGGCHVIVRTLIANNGNAAVKVRLCQCCNKLRKHDVRLYECFLQAIRSLRQWTFEEFGTDRLLEFVVMATPDDIEGNAEYISEGDFLVEVPEGPTENNYANIPLIVQIAEEYDCDAVWPGWGHASENFRFPLALKTSVRRPVWIGPSAAAMIALGDKIGSTIIAQSVGLRCLPWSGSDVRCDVAGLGAGNELPANLIALGCVHSAAEAVAVCERTGYPVVIKASAGGGGRGIRKVYRVEDVDSAFRQVINEVKDSPVFVMSLLDHCRHLEVQIVGDRFGCVKALGSRDCTVQRRCQKLIEEGPVVTASPEIVKGVGIFWKCRFCLTIMLLDYVQMEEDAVKLCTAVGYTSVATCEFLYDANTGNVYFLEVNARLQVEHVVTEIVGNLNLPAIQLQTAMGLPLAQIACLHNDDKNQPFGRNRHCIAARITAEHAEESFRPTCGQVFELQLRSSMNVWGYFSLGVTGKVHRFADSQIGHVFASGASREEARRHLVMALKRLTIRGEIRTNVEALLKILELPDFIENKTDTTWVEQCVQFDTPQGELPELPKRLRSITAESSPLPRHIGSSTLLAVLLAAAYEGFLKFKQSEAEFVEKIRQGQLPPAIQGIHALELVYKNVRFTLKCFHTGPCTISVALNDSSTEVFLRPISLSCSTATGTGSSRDCNGRQDGLTSSGCFLVSGGPDGRSRRVFYKMDAGGTCVTFDGSTFTFTKETDPTQVRAPVSGRLSRWLVPTGAPVQRGQIYAEIEIMKMYMQLQVADAGILSHALAEGAVFKTGDLLATLELPQGTVPEKAEEYQEPCSFDALKKNGSRYRRPARDDTALSGQTVGVKNPLRDIRQGRDCLVRALNGYHCTPVMVKQAFDACLSGFFNPSLPMYEILDVLSSMELQLPWELFKQLYQTIHAPLTGVEPLDSSSLLIDPAQDKAPCTSPETRNVISSWGVRVEEGTCHCTEDERDSGSPSTAVTVRVKRAFEALECFIMHHSASSSQEDTTFTQAHLEPLTQVLQKHQGGLLTTAAETFIGLLTHYLDIEEIFHQYDSEAASKVLLLKRTEVDADRLAVIARSHQALSPRNDLVIHLLGILRHHRQFAEILPLFNDVLQRLSCLTKPKYAAVSLRARQLLLTRRQRPFVERTLALIENFNDYLERRQPFNFSVQTMGSGSQTLPGGSLCWCPMSTHHQHYASHHSTANHCPYHASSSALQLAHSLHHHLNPFHQLNHQHHVSHHRHHSLGPLNHSHHHVRLAHHPLTHIGAHHGGSGPSLSPTVISGNGSVGATPTTGAALFLTGLTTSGGACCGGYASGGLFATVGGGFGDLGSLLTQTFVENLEDAADDSLIALLAHPNPELCKVALEVYVRRHHERCGLHDLRICCIGDVWWRQPFVLPTGTQQPAGEHERMNVATVQGSRCSIVAPRNGRASISASSGRGGPYVPSFSEVEAGTAVATGGSKIGSANALWSLGDQCNGTPTWRPATASLLAEAMPLSASSSESLSPPGHAVSLSGEQDYLLPGQLPSEHSVLRAATSSGACPIFSRESTACEEFLEQESSGVQRVNRLLAVWMCSALLSYEFLTQCCDIITEGRPRAQQCQASFVPTADLGHDDVDKSVDTEHSKVGVSSDEVLTTDRPEFLNAMSLFANHADNNQKAVTRGLNVSTRVSSGGIPSCDPPVLPGRDADRAESFGNQDVEKVPRQFTAAPFDQRQLGLSTTTSRLGLDSDSRLHHMLNAFASPGSDLHESSAGKLQMVVAMAFETFGHFRTSFEACLKEYAELLPLMPAAPPTVDGKLLLIFISEMNDNELLPRRTTTPPLLGPTNYYSRLEMECQSRGAQLAELGFHLVGFSFLCGRHLKDLHFESGRGMPKPHVARALGEEFVLESPSADVVGEQLNLHKLDGSELAFVNEASPEGANIANPDLTSQRFPEDPVVVTTCLKDRVSFKKPFDSDNMVNAATLSGGGAYPEEPFGDFDLVCSSVPRYLYFRNLAALPPVWPIVSGSDDLQCGECLHSSDEPSTAVVADFVEEPVLRNVSCSHFGQLELKRLSNFYIKVEPISVPHVHLFEAVPKCVNAGVAFSAHNSGRPEKASSVPLARFFVRILLHYQLNHKESDDWSELERHFVASLNALELALKSKSPRGQRPSPSHHILMNVILQGPAKGTIWSPASTSLVQPRGAQRISPTVAETVTLTLARRYEQRLMDNGVGTVEIRFAQRSFQASDTFVPIRIVITNPTRQSLQVQKFIEITDPTTGELIYSVLDASDSLAISVRYPSLSAKPPNGMNAYFAGRSNGVPWSEIQHHEADPTLKQQAVLHSGFHPTLGTSVSLGSRSSITGQRESVYDGLPVNTPHPLAGPLEEKRALAASLSTIYIYDFLELFEEAIKKQWQSCPKYFIPVFPGHETAGSLAGEGASPLKDSVDRSVFHPTAFIPDKVLESVELTLDHRAEVIETVREPGHNECGMVAWRVLMRTPEFPRGRRVILIGNDVTFHMGTFGVQEDLLFQRVSEVARKEGVPRIYIAVNSGARMGLATEVQKALHVEWVDPADPAKGFKYLYVTEEDYRQLRASESIAAEPVVQPSTNTCVYRLTSVVGSEVGLGVENLCGSGAIAGETSRAYKSNVTITFVTGRTVGIGAYITRLGQRVIQKASQAPILLTGYQAINRLIGRDVYGSNDELGGVDVMARNGVTHIVVGNDIEGCEEIVRWLSYVPEHTEGALPIMVDPTDPISRPVLYRVSSLTEDPRLMLTGCVDAKGRWLGGIFDRGSFREVLADWAKSVIVGRARLGGIPVGAIAVETRVTETVFPADPAVSDSSETTLLRAGQLWFPDSAYKTAQAISDFNREEIPLLIFANWRGFSGGQRDMFYEVLKFGSFIVDALVEFKQPCLVYIPPKAELRGGAWVVVDPRINSSYMDMFADPDSRGGVLEPTGTVEIKFRTAALSELAERLDTSLKHMMLKDQQLAAEGVALDDPRRALLKESRDKRLQELLPIYKQVAVHFADLHDTATRMKRRAAVHDIVPWERSRTYFYWRIRRQLIFFNLRTEILKANPTLSMAAAEQLIYKWAEESGHGFQGLRSSSLTAACALNAKFVQWACHALSDISRRLAVLRRDHHRSQVLSLLRKSPQLLVEAVHELAPNPHPHIIGKLFETVPEGSRDKRVY